LLAQVDVEPGFEALASRLLGRVVIDRDVTLEGVFREPGLVRAGSDPRVRLAARRRRLLDQLSALEPLAQSVPAEEERKRRAEARLVELQAAASQRPQLVEVSRQLEAAGQAEAEARARLPELERAAAEAEAQALRLRQAIEQHERQLAEHRAEVRRLELERARWSERCRDLQRQLLAVDADLEGMARGRAQRARRAAEASEQAAAVVAALPTLREAVDSARLRLQEAERESPDEEAEL